MTYHKVASNDDAEHRVDDCVDAIGVCEAVHLVGPGSIGQDLNDRYHGCCYVVETNAIGQNHIRECLQHRTRPVRSEECRM
jgi:hypothetical protein